MPKKPELSVNTTTLWEYPSQHYGNTMQGDKNYIGATPSYIIWNLLQRYTKEKDLVIDPMCGSGTTIDVCKDLNRKSIGYDINPTRPDIIRNDARKIPIEDNKVDFVFIDPPYSDHIDYSSQKGCIGNLSATEDEFYEAMEEVIAECFRVMKKDRCMGLYICDFFNQKTGFVPTGFRVYEILLKYFKPLDVVSVVRHNKSLSKGNWHKSASEQNFFLRGFNYLFIMQKATRKPIQEEIPRQHVKKNSRKNSENTDEAELNPLYNQAPPKENQDRFDHPHSSREDSDRPHTSRDRFDRPRRSREDSDRPHTSRDRFDRPRRSRDDSDSPRPKRDRSERPRQNRTTTDDTKSYNSNERSAKINRKSLMKKKTRMKNKRTTKPRGKK